MKTVRYTKLPYDQHDILIDFLRDSGQLTEDGCLLDLERLLDRGWYEASQRDRDPAKFRVPGVLALGKRWGVSTRRAKNIADRWRAGCGTERDRFLSGRVKSESSVSRRRVEGESKVSQPDTVGPGESVDIGSPPSQERVEGESSASHDRVDPPAVSQVEPAVSTASSPYPLAPRSLEQENKTEPVGRPDLAARPPAEVKGTLRPRTRTLLHSLGLTTLQQLSILTKEQLLGKEGVGTRTVIDVEHFLAANGLALKPPPPGAAHWRRQATDVWSRVWLEVTKGQYGPKYPWALAGPDRHAVPVWLEAAGFDVDEPEAGMNRLEASVRAYIGAAVAGEAWPHGEPPATKHYTRDVAKWMQAGAKVSAPPARTVGLPPVPVAPAPNPRWLAYQARLETT